MTESIHYVTVIDPVFEVTLSGTANAHIWQDYLQQEELEYWNMGDKVDVTVSAVESRFKRIQFREFSISLKIHENRYFLAYAFNSIALFAYAERTFFRTPYYKGDITIRRDYLNISHKRSLCFEARLPEGSPLIGSSSECDDLIVYLPRRLRKHPDHPHFFHAQLEGFTEVYSPGNMAMTPLSATNNPILKLLKTSQFEVRQWRVRQAARHSKSKTYIDKTRREMC